MYRPQTDPRVVSAGGIPPAPGTWGRVPARVWWLGTTSLVTDVSSEMITSILPAYLTLSLGVSPLMFGVLEGLNQGGASLARLVSGVASDRLRRYKPLAVAGYLASALSRVWLLVAGASASMLAEAIALDRVGKGVRTAPRDALISLSVGARDAGLAFGAHRMLDTIGATLGPLLAFAILWATQQDYPSVIVLSAAIGFIGVGVLVTFVREPAPVRGAIRSWRGTLAPLRTNAGLPFLIGSAALLGMATVSDGIVYLVLQRRGAVAVRVIPLLFVATSATYAALAWPAGWLADRVGRGVMLLAGYSAIAVLYAVLLGPGAASLTLAVAVLLLGAYYAATDGVLPALASTIAPESSRATAISLVGTALDAGRLVASAAFGWLWNRWSATTAVAGFLGFVIAVLAVTGARLVRLGAPSRSRDVVT